MGKSTRRKIKVLHSDNTGKYSRNPFLQLCREKGIEMHFIVRETPQQNGMAERITGTLLEKVQCMLSNTGILISLGWGISVCLLFVNMLPSSAIGGKTPIEAWLGRVAQDYDSLWVFDCPAYYHVKEDKLDSLARKDVIVWFKKGVKGYKMWDPKHRKFILSRDVTFDEASMMKPTKCQHVESKTTNRIP